jgi:uncharacterized membrane protein
MPQGNNSREPLPIHIEEAVRSIAELHADHHRTSTSTQRLIDRATAFTASPRFVIGLSFVAVGWIGFNLCLPTFGIRPIDPPPFAALSAAISLVSLYIVVLILATQRREYELAQLREQLTLELSIIAEQKTAKIIQLLEESRRENPNSSDRTDHQAEAMAQPTNPHSVLEAIRQTHAEIGLSSKDLAQETEK